jgi:hypothetical protein
MPNTTISHGETFASFGHIDNQSNDMENIQEEDNKAFMSQDELKDINIDQFKEEDTSIKNDKEKIACQLGSSTFIKLGFLADQKIPNNNSFHIDNDGLSSCFQNNKYTITNRIC